MAERRLEAARAEMAGVREESARALEAAERRHRADLAREQAEREKLRRRELQLEVSCLRPVKSGGMACSVGTLKRAIKHAVCRRHFSLLCFTVVSFYVT